MRRVLVVVADDPILEPLEDLVKLGLIDPPIVCRVSSGGGESETSVGLLGEEVSYPSLDEYLARRESRSERLSMVTVRHVGGVKSSEPDLMSVALAVGRRHLRFQGEQETSPLWIDLVSLGGEDDKIGAPADNRVVTVVVSPEQRRSPAAAATLIDSETVDWHRAVAVAVVVPLLPAQRGPLDELGKANDPQVFVARVFLRASVAPSLIRWIGDTFHDWAELPVPPGCVTVSPDAAAAYVDRIVEGIVADAALMSAAYRPPSEPRFRIGPRDALFYVFARTIRAWKDSVSRALSEFAESVSQTIEDYLTRVFFGADGSIRVAFGAGELEQVAELPSGDRLPDADALNRLLEAVVKSPEVVDVGEDVARVREALVGSVDGGSSDRAGSRTLISDAALVARDPARWRQSTDLESSPREQWLARGVTLLRESVDEALPDGCAIPTQVHVIEDVVEKAFAQPDRSVIGVCASQPDGTALIAIHVAAHAEPIDVLATLAHELLHAGLDPADAHGPRFSEAMGRLGLEGPPESSVAGEAFRAMTNPILEELGALPPQIIPLVERVHVRAGEAARRAWSRTLAATDAARAAASDHRSTEEVSDVGSPATGQQGSAEGQVVGDEAGSDRQVAGSTGRAWVRRLVTVGILGAGIFLAVSVPSLAPFVALGMFIEFGIRRPWRWFRSRIGLRSRSAEYRRSRRRLIRQLLVGVLVAAGVVVSIGIPVLLPYVLIAATLWLWRLVVSLIEFGRVAADEDFGLEGLSAFDRAYLELQHHAREALRLRRMVDAIDRMGRSIGFVVHHPLGLDERSPEPPLPQVAPSKLPLGAVIEERTPDPITSRKRLHATRDAVFHRGWLSELLAVLGSGFSDSVLNIHDEDLLGEHPPVVLGPAAPDNNALAYLMSGECTSAATGWLDASIAAAIKGTESTFFPDLDTHDLDDLALDVSGTPLTSLWTKGHMIGSSESWLLADGTLSEDSRPSVDRVVELEAALHDSDRPFVSILARLDLWRCKPETLAFFTDAESD